MIRGKSLAKRSEFHFPPSFQQLAGVRCKGSEELVPYKRDREQSNFYRLGDWLAERRFVGAEKIARQFPLSLDPQAGKPGRAFGDPTKERDGR